MAVLLAVAAGPVRLAAESSDDVAPALTLRVLNALFMGLGVALTGWAAAKMFPGRGRQVTVVAAGVAAVLPVVVGNAALGYNDGLALVLNAASLGVMALLLRGGPTRRLVVAATALAAACLLTRASLLPVVAGLAAAALLGAWRRDWRRWPGRGVASSATIVGGAALAAGWFYARNIALYGDATGASYLLPRLGRVPAGRRARSSGPSGTTRRCGSGSSATFPISTSSIRTPCRWCWRSSPSRWPVRWSGRVGRGGAGGGRRTPRRTVPGRVAARTVSGSAPSSSWGSRP